MDGKIGAPLTVKQLHRQRPVDAPWLSTTILRVAQFFCAPGSFDLDKLSLVLCQFGLQEKFARWQCELQSDI
jgi:hypothetical protein